MATQNIFDLTDTWNAGGTTFTAIKMNVTNTASASGSLLIDLQNSGTTRFSVRASNGNVFTTGSVQIGTTSASIGDQGAGFFTTRSSGQYAWSSTSDAVSGTIDLILARDAANTLAQRNGTNAQTHRWYRSFTDASNYSRVSLGWSSSTAILATEGAGTGARGNIAFGTAALATSATVGYVMIPSCAGAPTGVPADIPTGQVALHYDTTNNRIYAYNGAWRMIAVV